MAMNMTVIENGGTNYQIVTPGRSYPVENEAARRLQEALRQISGVRVPIRWGERKTPRIPTIFVGRTESADPGLRDRDEYRIDVRGRDLLLTGLYRRGTHYAVTAFLESLGTGFYHPDNPEYPQLDRIELPNSPVASTGAFSYRHVFYPDAQRPERALQLMLNVHDGDDDRWGPVERPHSWGHSFSGLVPTDRFFDSHPEYYSLVDGYRRRERPQLCATNPEVADVAAETMARWIRAHPRRRIFAVGQNDWHNYCECPECAKVDEREGSHMGQVLTLVNRVAERFPDRVIATLAYQWTVEPPKAMKPRENVLIVLCHNYGCYNHGLDECELNAPFLERLKRWRKLTPNILIWDYYVNYRHYLLPTGNFRRIGNDFRIYRDIGVPAMFCQGSACTGGQFEHLRQYVQSKLLWNPDLSVDALMSEWAEGYFGKDAAAPILEYLFTLEDAERADDVHMYRYSQLLMPDLFTPKLMEQGKRLWDAAEKAAPSEESRRRVFAVRSAEMAARIVHAPGEYVLRGDELILAPPPDRKLVDRFVDACLEANVSYLREDIGAPEDFRHDFGKTYRAVVLENGNFEAVVLPELGARIYSLVHKESNTELLAVPQIYANVTSAPHTDGYDFQLSPPEYRWRVGIGAREAYTVEMGNPTHAVFTADVQDGLHIETTIELMDAGFSVRHRVTNTGSGPMTVHPDINPAWNRELFDDDARLETTIDSGEIISQGLNPEHRDTRDLIFVGEEKPSGSWTLSSAVGSTNVRIVIHADFPASEVSHTRLVLSSRLVQMRHYFGAVEIAPGEEKIFVSGWKIAFGGV